MCYERRTNFSIGLTVAFEGEASSFSVAWLIMDHLSNSLRDFCSAIVVGCRCDECDECVEVKRV